MRYFILTLVLLTANSISGQHLTEEYVDLGIGFGARSIGATPGLYNLSFDTNLEEYSFEQNILENNTYTGINIGLSFGKYKGLNHTLYFDLPIGRAVGGSGSGKAGYSIGWGFAFEVGNFDLLLRPSIGISNGNTDYRFGSFRVDTISQFINGEEFNDVTVNVHLNHRSTYVTSDLKTTFLIAQKLGLYFSVGYDHQFTNKIERFNFTSIGDNTSSQSIEIQDPYLQYQEIQIGASNPVIANILQPGGLRFTFGIAIYYNKDLYD